MALHCRLGLNRLRYRAGIGSGPMRITTSVTRYWKFAAMNEVEPLIIPPEVLDLLRFMCATWTQIDRWAYEHAGAESMAHYPVVQGTVNQINLQRIGEQPHNTANLHKAVKWMRENAA